MEKLLAIASLGQRAYGRRLSQKLVSGMILIAGLVIVIALLVSAMLIGGLTLTYFTLLQYGIAPVTAIIIIAILTLLTIMVLILLTLSCLHRLRQMPRSLFRHSPFLSRVTDVVEAFTAGLMAK